MSSNTNTKQMHTSWMLALLVFISSITMAQEHTYNIRSYGAVGDGKTDDALAIQRAIDACSQTGGVVIIPSPATFMAGPFNLKSNVELYLEAGATLLANPDERVYTKSAFRDNPGEGTIWIGGEHITNVSIRGMGTIDGNGISFMGKEEADAYVLKPFQVLDPRPHVLTIVDGTNIRIHDVHIGNAAYWTIHLVGCNDVVISGITLLNSLKVRNSDGIDLDHSKNVRISDCYIESGDDCICLKNRREYAEYGTCENITVSNCTMTSRSCAIKIGSENMDTIQQVLFTNILIKNSNRGVGIQHRDEGVVRDVIFSNMIIEGHLFSDVWWGKAEPIYVTAYRRAAINHKDANWRFPKGATEGKVGTVSNIFFSNITCTSENGVYVSGEPGKINGVYFDQVTVRVQKSTMLPGGVYDRRPAQVEGFVTGTTSGFYIDQAEGVVIRNSAVAWGSAVPPYFKHAIELVNAASTIIQNFNGVAADPKKYKAITKRVK